MSISLNEPHWAGFCQLHLVSQLADSFSEDFEPEQQRRARGVVDKYVPVRQPIAKRAPDGLNLVRLTWIICRKWNSEFFPDLEDGN